jgi:hypothetical protein
MHGVDPTAGQVGERGEVLRPGQPLRLEAAHLAGGGGGLPDGPAAHHPAHRRVAAQPLGILYVLVAGEAAEHGLPQQADQTMPAVLAGARIRQRRARGQAQRVVELAVAQQARIGGDRGATEAEHQAAVEVEPQGSTSRFTRRVRHGRPTR